jgi:DNA polymerase III subunit delta'
MQPWLVPYQQQLRALLARQQLAHGMLFSGPAGIGKQVLLQWLAASLLCTADNKPCGQCKSCLLRAAGSHADMLVIDSSGSSIGVDAVRQLSQFMYGRAQQQMNKVVVLAHAEKLTEAAANALLKTLEEPPQNSFLLIASSVATTLPATMLSRCQHWVLAPEFGRDAQQWLAQQSNQSVPDFLLAYCGGAPLKALALLESNEAGHISTALQALTQFITGQLTLGQCIKQLDTVTELNPLFGWFMRQQLRSANADLNPERRLALNELYSRWCRDAMQILGQNKQLALSAMLSELKRLLS